jgi:release factor glutamine methyltransferase
VTFEEGARRLAEAGLESPRAEARLFYAHALGVSRDETLSPGLKPTPAQAAQFAAMIARRAAREPSAYITGVKEFWSMDFAVGPGVLVPRPETETLIEEALKLFADKSVRLRIADLGAGSGVILLAALKEFPNARGIGFESSPAAFAWANRNAARHAADRAEIHLADWTEAEGFFDLIFSNPPYIRSGEIAALDPEVSCFEPRAALDGGPDGLSAYRALRNILPGKLKPEGRALLELGAGQAESVAALFRASTLRPVRTVPDLAGIPRVLVLEKDV